MKKMFKTRGIFLFIIISLLLAVNFSFVSAAGSNNGYGNDADPHIKISFKTEGYTYDDEFDAYTESEESINLMGTLEKKNQVKKFSFEVYNSNVELTQTGNIDIITIINGCFMECTKLTSIPAGLFDNCINVTDFGSCFSYCNSLSSIPDGLFDLCVSVKDFGSCFYNDRCLTGTAPRLWDRLNVRGALCFTGCTGLSNYPDIPAGWK